MISVLVVTYNGETYIREQIDSILKNIGLGDELVVSDDGSLDTTREILKSYQEQDARIRVMEGPGEGVISNVEAGLRACRGDYIFLADQDDVWMPDKVEKVMEVFRRKKAMVVVHDARVTDAACKETLMPSFLFTATVEEVRLKILLRIPIWAAAWHFGKRYWMQYFRFRRMLPCMISGLV